MNMSAITFRRVVYDLLIDLITLHFVHARYFTLCLHVEGGDVVSHP